MKVAKQLGARHARLWQCLHYDEGEMNELYGIGTVAIGIGIRSGISRQNCRRPSS